MKRRIISVACKLANVWANRCLVRIFQMCTSFVVLLFMNQIPGIAPVGADPFQPVTSTNADKLIIAHSVPGGGNNGRTSFVNALALSPDYIEADLQLTKDGILVCLHDPFLEKNSNISDVFPDRFKMVSENGEQVKRWFVNDFTLAEIKELIMAVPLVTLKELVDLIGNTAGLYLEPKDHPFYQARGVDIELQLHQFLNAEVFAGQAAAPIKPVILESFHERSLHRLRELGGDRYTLIQLIWFSTWHLYMTEKGLEHVASYADGIGPMLSMILPPSSHIIKAAHANKLVVHGWKGYAAFPPKGYDIEAYSDYLLYGLKLDGLMTKAPDKIKRR
ncbi:MAG: hypothetical protein JKY34_07840 [Kordiimonadaceae bacterium]|nr:hypothetical protein [Kordiimonadaceae bacterium]